MVLSTYPGDSVLWLKKRSEREL